jgi:hypothetical protein
MSSALIAAGDSAATTHATANASSSATATTSASATVNATSAAAANAASSAANASTTSTAAAAVDIGIGIDAAAIAHTDAEIGAFFAELMRAQRSQLPLADQQAALSMLQVAQVMIRTDTCVRCSETQLNE